MASTSAFLVPADAPGVVVGERTGLLGMRAAWHADVAFEGVEVGADQRLGEEAAAWS